MKSCSFDSRIDPSSKGEVVHETKFSSNKNTNLTDMSDNPTLYYLRKTRLSLRIDEQTQSHAQSHREIHYDTPGIRNMLTEKISKKLKHLG